LQYSSEDLYLQTQLNVLPYYFSSPAAALFGLSTGQVDGVLIGVIPAVSYIKDLYDGFLKIAGQPIGNSGIRLLTKKGENQQLIQSVNQAFQIEKNQKKYGPLMVKWTVGTEN
jgi:ABC-type amino acid transport substrate-binding protein